MDEDPAALLISDNKLNKKLINSGGQLGGLGTPAEMLGSPNVYCQQQAGKLLIFLLFR